MMLSIDRRGHKRARQKGIQVNRIDITENDSRLAAEACSEILLRQQLDRLRRWSGKMKSVQGLRPINATCVIPGTRRVTETGGSKQDKHCRYANDSFSGNNVIRGPRDGQNSDAD